MSKPYFAETTVRWSDLDANMHLANSSYMNFTSFARIDFLNQKGVKLSDLGKLRIGPAILREEFSFFKEAHSGQKIIISVEITGGSEDGTIFEFEHNLYDKETGTHLAYSRVFGVWFSTLKREMCPLPDEIFDKIKSAASSDKFRTLTHGDLRNLPVRPDNIDPKTFK